MWPRPRLGADPQTVYAATIRIVQNDLKRVIAYSIWSVRLYGFCLRNLYLFSRCFPSEGQVQPPLAGSENPRSSVGSCNHTAFLKGAHDVHACVRVSRSEKAPCGALQSLSDVEEDLAWLWDDPNLDLDLFEDPLAGSTT